MRSPHPLVLLLAFLPWPTLPAAAAAPDVSAEVAVSAENQQRMGVTVASVERQVRPVVVNAYVRAVDVVPLLTLVADREAARAAADASEAEFARVSTLAAQEQSASARDVESARSLALTDRSRAELLARRLLLEWSPDLARRIAQDPTLLESLSRGETVLLRADAPGHPEGVVGEVAISAATGTERLRAEPVGLSSLVDPQLQTVGLYLLARPDGRTSVRPGRLVEGEIRTAEVAAGYLLPNSSVVRIGESRWVYIQTGSTTFERRSLSAAEPLRDAWFVPGGFTAGERVAVTGAESLLAVERAADSPETD